MMNYGNVVAIPYPWYLELKRRLYSREITGGEALGFLVHRCRPRGKLQRAKIAVWLGVNIFAAEAMFYKGRKLEKEFENIPYTHGSIYVPKEAIRVLAGNSVRRSYLKILFYLLEADKDIGFITNIHLVKTAANLEIRPRTLELYLGRLVRLGVVFKMKTPPFEKRILGVRCMLSHWFDTPHWELTEANRALREEEFTRIQANSLSDTKKRKLSFKARLKKALDEKPV